jgi:hypothetical protein
MTSINTRFASMFAAIACGIITIGFSVAPAVAPVSALVA